jgi:hypothetical protein
MLRTGTSENGRVYRYYTCSNCATKGKAVCKGRSIPMEKLDRLVTDHLMERLFKPELAQPSCRGSGSLGIVLPGPARFPVCALGTTAPRNCVDVRFTAECVAKLVLHWVSKILRAIRAAFV